jgi:hypothetical protein
MEIGVIFVEQTDFPRPFFRSTLVSRAQRPPLLRVTLIFPAEAIASMLSGETSHSGIVDAKKN